MNELVIDSKDDCCKTCLSLGSQNSIGQYLCKTLSVRTTLDGKCASFELKEKVRKM